jgi:YVTN family beta-propeller protein
MNIKLTLITAIFAAAAGTSFAQSPYANDRVYAANQVSNTISVVDPSSNKLLGEIKLGDHYPNVLNPLYKGQALVHGLRYSQEKKMLAVVSIGSNSVTLISTETNKVLKTIYVGRSPHEPTFTPDSKQVWISVRGESYISVIDIATLKEIRRVPVANGPGMVSFSPDGKMAYVCSSFTPELQIINTNNYVIVKSIPVVSPFSPNIFTSPDGSLVAMTHKDVGKVTVIDTKTKVVKTVLTTGPITNHVTFAKIDGQLRMIVTVGGENKVRFFDPNQNFRQTDTVIVGALPHGLWTSGDGKLLYVGLEYADEVQAIDLKTMKSLPPVKIGQSPQALVYAPKAVTGKGTANLSPLGDTLDTQIITLKGNGANQAIGRLAIRPIGLANLVEQIFTGLQPGTAYTLTLTKSKTAPYNPDHIVNSFTTDTKGKFVGQSTSVIKHIEGQAVIKGYEHVILLKDADNTAVLLDR